MKTKNLQKLKINKIPKKEDLIHIKLEYNEAVKSKRDMLSSEIGLLNILKIIKRYHALRLNELEKKIILQRKINELKLNIKKLQNILPQIKIPEILSKKIHIEEQSENENIEPINHKEIKEEYGNQDLEKQLMEIRQKLNALQG